MSSASADRRPRGEASEPGAPFIVGGGETGALVRSIDWAQTPLGPASAWPQSLRTTLGICVSSRFPTAIYWGPEFVMLYNDSLLPMVGANKHPQAMGRPAFEVLPEVRAILEPLLVHVRTTGEATWSEDSMLPLVRGDAAEEGYFTFTYSPVRDESGAVAGVLCAVLETTEKIIEGRRLRLLAELAEATQRQTKEDACAHAAARIAEATRDVPFALLYLIDEAAGVARLAGTANLAAGAARSPETLPLGEGSIWPLTPKDPDGNALPAIVELGEALSGARSAVVLPIERSGGGTPFGFLVAGLSPLLGRSPSYARFHHLLAASVSHAVSNAAAHEEARKRADALAELDRAKTTFFSNVSHELRTPLTLMLAAIRDLLSMRDGAPADRQAVELLHRNALRLLKLVNTLLEFSRIEAGRVEATYEPVDLDALTADLASNFRAAVESAGLRLVIDCPPLPEPVYVDRDMWEKIVLNLVSNAFKFTFEGSIRVSLRLEGEGAVLEVADTGTGIAAQEQLRLFERFHRIEDARSRSHEGSGIGLALIQELARLHGGDIQVTSEVGVGSTFRVRVPRGTAHLPATRIRAPRSRASTAIGASAFVEEAARWALPDADTRVTPPPAPEPLLQPRTDTKERILVADDNADMREYLARVLVERWNVETVGDGEAALESARREPPALVLSDVMMPRLDGMGLVKAMREDPALRGTPVIMLSARAGEEEATKGLVTGADDYIAKPFSARDLVARVASTLATARAAREMVEMREQQRANLYRHFMQVPFPVAVFKGASHVIELANPSILRAWGKGSDIVGRPLAQALPELVGQPFLRYLDGVLSSGTTYEGRAETASLPTGPAGELEPRDYDFVYAPLRDAGDSVEGVLVAAFDVTAQVRASRAKDEFLATMSHELRTPLNAIVGWSQLLRAGRVKEEEVPKALETIERNARVQSRLIEDMLDLTRIEQGKLVLAVASVEMARVVEAAIDAVRPAAEAKGIRLQPVLDSEATIAGDADRLQQVAWNILSNAIKFTPKGGRVQVCLRRDQSHVELVVADNGQGVDAHLLPHVFDRFRQGDSSSSRKAGGLGLGLAIVRSIVELHGGTVAMESQGLGQGTTVVVKFPTAPVRAERAPGGSNASIALETSVRAPQTLLGLRILVVDDDPEARELLRQILEQCQSVVTVADGADQGLAAVREGAHDLVISDVGMPEHDGYWLIGEIRALPPHRGGLIPAVALSAYAGLGDRTQALQDGFDVHLAKPIEPEELVAVVARLAEGARWRSPRGRQGS